MGHWFNTTGHLLDLTLERLIDGELTGTEEITTHLQDCVPCRSRLEVIEADSALALPPLRLPDPLQDRSGHLTDLTLERLVDGELAQTAAITAHLQGCAPCQARRSAIAADDAVALPPRSRTAAPEAPADNVVPFRPQRSWWSAAGGLLAAAAAVLLLVNVGPTTAPFPPLHDTDRFTAKGADLPALKLEVYRNEAGSITRISSDDAVFPGDQLGFRVGSEADGHLMILGIDSTGTPYPCYPADGSPASLSQGEPAEVPGSIHLDETLGVERLVAVRCPQPAAYDELAGALTAAAAGLPVDDATPQLKDGCAQQEVRLSKEPRR